MNILLNGQARELKTNTTLKQLIELEGMAGKRLAAEVNKDIIPKAEHENCILYESDNVEIVHAIGGG